MLIYYYNSSSSSSSNNNNKTKSYIASIPCSLIGALQEINNKVCAYSQHDYKWYHKMITYIQNQQEHIIIIIINNTDNNNNINYNNFIK